MKYLAYIAGLILLFGLLFFLLYKPSTPGKFDDLAKCIAEKNLTMYGAYWCSHCQNQKKLFGDSFKYVPYVECTVKIKDCQDKNINGYPTWIDAAGNRYEGEQTLSKLAEITSCPLP